MQPPEFLRFSCTTSDAPACAGCAREFVLPLGAIEGVYRTPDGFAEIGLKGSHLMVCPLCDVPNAPPHHRYIKTGMAWDAFLSVLGGSLGEVGSITMVE